MSQPVKPAVLIAILAAAIIVLILIGYKFLGPTHTTARTDPAAKQVIAAMAAARAAGKGGKAPHPQGQPIAH